MDDKNVRITVSVPPEVAATIAELATRMNASQSRMASWLLEAGLEDHEVVIRLVTSKVMKGLKQALTSVGRKKTKPST